MTSPITIKNTAIALSNRVQNIKPSPTFAISARAEELQAQGKPIINLSVGEPDFDTPDHIKAAAIQAIQEGKTKYTAVEGMLALKQAVINKFKNENNLHYEINQILVSCGAKHSIYNALSALLNPGDEVIIPAPFWVSYPDIAKLNEGSVVFVKTTIEQQFKMTPAQLEQAITDKTRAVIINSPSNPTGQAYTAQELKALSTVLLRYPHIAIISDDIYEHHLWNHLPFTNIVNVCPDLKEQCIVINGVSKTYAMTGWRIGYAAGPAAVIGAMKKAQSQSTSNPATPSQYAAYAALQEDQHCVAVMTQAYKARHDFLVSELQKIPGIKCIPSDGTFYTFPNVEALFNEKMGITDDLRFAEYLLNEAEIAVIPGSAFGVSGHIRLCYTVSQQDLEQAIERLHKVIQQLGV